MPRERAAKRKVCQEKELSIESVVDRQRYQQKKLSSERCFQKRCQEKGVWMHSRSCEHSRGMFSLPETSPAACHCTVCNVERDCAFCYRILCGWDCVSSNSAALGNREETQTEHPPTECLFSTPCICMWQFELQGCETNLRNTWKQNMVRTGYIPDGLETGPWQQFHWVGCSTPDSQGAQFFAESDLRGIPGHC
jgi:hypothetical protein